MIKPAGCAGCPLEKIGTGFTEVEVGKRYATTHLLLVGESSGESESREGLPFRPHAQSGSLLADAMREVHIGREEVAITNVVRCRPPKDWLEGAPWAYGAVSQCTTNYLTKVIEELNPRAIVALGGTAFRTLVNAPKGKYGTLDYVRGYVHEGAGAATGRLVVPTYHPAFLRRGASHLTPLLQRDLRRGFLLAGGKLQAGRHYATQLEELGASYLTAPTIDEAWEWARDVDPDLPLAFDIETPMSTRSDEDERTAFTDRDIRLFQCTQTRGTGIALPFREDYTRVIESILDRAKHKVGFNNWNFDDAVLLGNGIDVGVTDDAMVMFGTFWSDLPKNLQAAAQMCGFPMPWKHFGEEDLALYGCMDVDATLCVYEHMKRVLEGEEI
jgi:DNA polymerase